MTDNLTVFGTDYTGVTGIKATGTGNGTLTYIRPQGTKSISANSTGIDVTEYASVDVAVPAPTPSLQAKTNIAPSTSSQTITADSGYDGLSSVQINAMPSGTAGNPTATKGTVSNHSISVTPSVTNTTGYISGGTKTGTAVSVSASELVSGTYTVSSTGTTDVTNYANISVAAQTLPTSVATSSSGTSKATIGRQTSTRYLNIPTGYNVTAQYYTISAVADGTAGTPTATKGTVSNHSISVTPSVTNTTGYITGGTKTGTAVSVSASELVSGNLPITQNTASTDCTNYATVSVAIPIVTYYTSTSTPTSSQGSNGDIWLVTS